MKTVMSLDISSSTIGWALIEYNDVNVTFKAYGHIKPLKKEKTEDLTERLNPTFNSITKLINLYSPDEIAVENYVSGFTSGFSRASTIMLLSSFNETVCLAAYRANQNKIVFRYAVPTIRASISKILNKKIVSKDEVADSLLEICKIYKPTLNKKGTKMKAECFDELDALAVGMTYIYKEHYNEKLIWNI